MLDWRLDKRVATLRRHDENWLRVDMGNPSCGVEFADGSAAVLKLIEPVGLGDRIKDSFIRGVEAIADYAADGEVPCAIRLYWNVAEIDQGVRLDFSAVVRTPAWVWTPNVVVGTDFGKVQPRQLPMDLEGRSDLRPIPEGRSVGPSGPILFPAGGGHRVEMVDPTDLQSVAYRAGRIEYCMLGEPLEKGVIRRTRIREVWLADEPTAAEIGRLWRDFLDAPISLTP